MSKDNCSCEFCVNSGGCFASAAKVAQKRPIVECGERLLETLRQMQGLCDTDVRGRNNKYNTYQVYNLRSKIDELELELMELVGEMPE